MIFNNLVSQSGGVISQVVDVSVGKRQEQTISYEGEFLIAQLTAQGPRGTLLVNLTLSAQLGQTPEAPSFDTYMKVENGMITIHNDESAVTGKILILSQK